ncbi:MAG TPA: hypothetical protein P5519_07260 [Spirochaetia bacterium]|nr:hypothetical protein [Spirochaetales bacterium]HRS65671.1 hypothetical protein [Spirochaetia bacterium]HOT58680.1 hypothetical protein [Spirochaetales bacterium]HPD79928.1 hypothetical protein [Spirochaetales bacterium]HQK33512.1 hypothetical protein [Spirochaetales bacterium]
MHTHKILLICYNHLPEHVSVSEFEEKYQYCYRPFLSVLNKFPEIPVSLYFSGTLLKMLELKHPEFLLLLNEMISKKQVELLGGAFNYSILPLQTNHERIATSEMLTNYIRKKFSKRPRGFLLPEFLWSNSLIATLVNAGFEYTFIEQTKSDYCEIQNPLCFTEENYKPLKIFRTVNASNFDNLLPNEIIMQIDEVSKHSHELHSYSIAIKGESFKDLCITRKFESPDYMMEKLFSWFRKNILEYEPILPSKFNKLYGNAISRTYFKDYFPESLTTVFSTLKANNKNKKAFPELFVEIKELENYYAKINFVRLLLKNEIRGDKERKRAGTDMLSFAFGSDMFNTKIGFINRECRKKAWYFLIEAEKCTNGKKHAKSLILEQDYNLDNLPEIIIRYKTYDCILNPHAGTVTEFDYFPLSYNICSIIVPVGDRAELFEDYLHTGATAKSITYAQHTIDHERTLIRLYAITEMLQIEKIICFTASSILIDYQFTNTTEKELSCTFKTVLNLAIDFELADIESEDINKKDETLSKDFCKKAISAVKNQEILLPFSCGSSIPCVFKTYPILYQVDKKELYRQGTKLECDWTLSIKAQNQITVHFAFLF